MQVKELGSSPSLTVKIKVLCSSLSGGSAERYACKQTNLGLIVRALSFEMEVSGSNPGRGRKLDVENGISV